MSKTFQLILIILLSFIIYCKKPIDKIKLKKNQEPSTLSCVVVYSQSESKVYHSDLTEEKGAIGVSFRKGDRLQTGDKGVIDVQIGEASSIRLEPNTSIEFLDLNKDAKGQFTTAIFLKRGKLFAGVEAKDKDSYSISTGTAVLTSLGGYFSIEIVNGQDTMIRNLEGKTSVQPYIDAFKISEPSEVLSLDDRNKIDKLLSSKKISITEEQEVFVSFPDAVIDAINNLSKETFSVLVKNLESYSLQSKPAGFTKQQEQQLKTLTKIPAEKTLRLMQINEELSLSTTNEEQVVRLETEKKQIQQEIFSYHEKQKEDFKATLVNKPKKLFTKKEIIKYYERVERISLINGKIEIGSIIDQIGTSLIIVHTESGVKRIPMETVIEVIYDFKAKKE